MRLVELEPGSHDADGGLLFRRGRPAAAPAGAGEFGRAAIAAYVDGIDGRLMRSMKSILGSSLVEQTTDVGGGRGVRYLDIVAGYLRHLKRRAEAAAGAPIDRAVLGRPVFFVDDDPERDAQAEAALEARRASVGFREVVFQYEPIAAAFDYEQAVDARAERAGRRHRRRHLRLLGRARRPRAHGAGSIARATSSPTTACTSPAPTSTGASSSPRILPLFGYGAFGPSIDGAPPREVPSAVYFDLATWHLINTVYNPQRVVELRGMRSFYADAAPAPAPDDGGRPSTRPRTRGARRGREDRRRRRRPHDASISATSRPGSASELDEAEAAHALDADIERIVAAARDDRRAGRPARRRRSTRSTSPAARPASTC